MIAALMSLGLVKIKRPTKCLGKICCPLVVMGEKVHIG